MVNKMRQYKGYYIDKVIFNNEKEIDEFIRNQAIEKYKQSVRWFCERPSMQFSIYSGECAERLVEQFGFTWEEIEEMEIEVMKEIA